VPRQQDWSSSVLRDIGIDPADTPSPPTEATTPPDPPTAPPALARPEALAPPPAQVPPSAPSAEPQASVSSVAPPAQVPPAQVPPAQVPPAQVPPAQVPPTHPSPQPTSPRPPPARSLTNSGQPPAVLLPTDPGRPPAVSPPAEPRPPVFLDPAGLTRTHRHRDPPALRATRAVRRVLGVGTSREVREAAAYAEQLRQPVTTARRIAVLSVRGGAGKTTVTTLLATALAGGRNDRVLAVDAAPGLGSLALQAGATSRSSVTALGRAAPLRNFEEAEPHLGRADSGMWLLTGPPGDAGEPDPPTPTYQAAVAALSRFFAVLVTDCGPDASSDLNREILADAHALALVTPATVDGLVSAYSGLGWLRRTLAALASRTVVVLVNHSPHADGADLKRGSRALASQGVRVARFPYDRSLAAGARIEPHLLGEQTRQATLRLAADLLTFAVGQRGGR
jgi:MinD-like ATPase involved in chromosome partitioning or flagellar assembly